MLRKTPTNAFIDSLQWFSSLTFDLATKLVKKSKPNTIEANADFVMLTVRSDKPAAESASK